MAGPGVGTALSRWAGIVGAPLAVDGVAIGAVGPAAIAPAGAVPRWLPDLLIAAGGVLVAVALAGLASDARRAPLARVPQLFPFASPRVQVALYVAIVVGAVAVFQATFETFTPAHGGADLGAASSGEAGVVLVAAASGLLWLLTVYAVLVVRSVIRLGRWVDRSEGPSAYGAEASESDPEPLAAPVRRPADPAPIPRGPLYVATLILGLGASVAIQTLEVATQPAPFGDWAWAQLALPVWLGLVVSGIAGIDRGIRDLEGRCAAAFGAAASDRPVGGTGH